MQTLPFLSLAPQHDRIRIELEKSFKKVIAGSNFILGSEVAAFEGEYATFSGVQHCVAVANGLDALYISLKCLSIGGGDEVIVPALTCAPTWIAVSRTGAVPVPVDVHPQTFNIDVGKINPAVTTRTKAIIPVNLYGRPADLLSLAALTVNREIFIVEDNAQGHGASILGKMTGSFGKINGTSFYPAKNLGALGDGGAITTDDALLAAQARVYRNYGLSSRFHHEVTGVNSRLDELQAAFLRIKLGYLKEWNEQRKQIAARYSEEFVNIGDLLLPVGVENSDSNFHLFVLCTERRDGLREYLKQLGIGTDIHYPVPPHLQPVYAHLGYKPNSFPVAEKISSTILSLPIWTGMTDAQTEFVCSHVQKFFKK